MLKGSVAVKSDSGFSSETTSPSSQQVRNVNIIDSHWVAAVGGCVILDDFQVPASKKDETACHVTGPSLPDAVCYNHSPPLRLSSSSQLSAAPTRKGSTPRWSPDGFENPSGSDKSSLKDGVPELYYR